MFAYCSNNPVIRIDPTGCVSYAEGGNPFDTEEREFELCGGPCISSASGRQYGPGSAYNNYKVRTNTSNYDATRGGYYSGLSSSAINNITAYVVEDAISVTDDMAVQQEETFLPDSYYTKKAPLQSTPNSSYIHYRYNKSTGEYEMSTVYYNIAGYQYMRIDWTNHGRIDHSNPHIHFRFYDKYHSGGVKWRLD